MNKSVVIIYLGDFFFDARAINMSLSLINSGYSVSVVSVDKKSYVYPEFKNVRFYFIKLINNNFMKYFEFIRKARKILNNKSYDIIISGDLYSLPCGVFGKHRGRLIYDSREIYTKLSAHEKKPFIRFCVSIYEKKILRYVDSVLVTAESDLQYLKKKYVRFNNCSWHTIYNYPLSPTFTTKINFRKKFKIPDNNTLIVYQGVLQRGRGIKALLYLSSIMSNVSAVIIGGGQSQNTYIEFAKKLKVNHKTVFIQKIPYIDLIGYTASCDIGWGLIKNFGVSNYFSLPNKLFEYSLAGLPAIVSNLPNMRLIVEKYNLGLVVSEKNVAEQCDAVNFLIENKKPQKFYRNVAKQNFIWNLQSKKFINIISG
jgi:glycosyltransferase involved in cell wall biosynthesis